MQEDIIIQVDGSFLCVLKGPIVKAVIVPGKLVNLLTKEPDLSKCVEMREDELDNKTYTPDLCQ